MLQCTDQLLKESKDMAEVQPQVHALIDAAYGPGDIVSRGSLQTDCDLLLKEMTDQYDAPTALTYLGHVLQELRIADVKQQTVEHGVNMDSLHHSIGRSVLDIRQTAVRFTADSSGLLVPKPVQPTLENLKNLPLFDGEILRDKRVLFLGMGGGSDVVQAAALSELLTQLFNIQTVDFASVRKAANTLAQASQVSAASATLKQIHRHTKARGDWRFLEKVMLEPGDPLADVPMHIINSIAPEDVARDLAILTDELQPDVIIGCDTGGDSWYASSHPGFSDTTDTTPDQDIYILQALRQLSDSPAVQNGNLTILPVVIAPGVDSPPYASKAAVKLGGRRLDIPDTALQYTVNRYHEWRMDGSGNDEGRYGKTPLAWLAAIQRQYGLQVLNLPVEDVISRDNPWRAYLQITPAMGEVVFTDINRYDLAA